MVSCYCCYSSLSSTFSLGEAEVLFDRMLSEQAGVLIDFIGDCAEK